MSGAGKNVLLTGRPGVGKTTLIRKISGSLNKKVGGFYTEEIRQDGVRKGFGIKTFDGREGILAHQNIKGRYKVSKYGINLQDLEGVAAASIEDAIAEDEVIIIDEIGKMELYSDKFRAAVIRALNSPKQVMATIGAQRHAFLDEIKRHPDVELITVTVANRDSLAEDIIRDIVSRM